MCIICFRGYSQRCRGLYNYITYLKYLTQKKVYQIDLDVLGSIFTQSDGSIRQEPKRQNSNPNDMNIQMNMSKMYDQNSSQLSQIRSRVNHPITANTMGPQLQRRQNIASVGMSQGMEIDTSLFVHDKRTEPYFIRGSQADTSHKYRMVPKNRNLGNKSVDCTGQQPQE